MDENSKENDYLTINKILNHDGNYLIELIEKVKKISSYIKKLQIVDDQTYYTSKSEEYKKLLKKTKINLEKIFQKIFTYTHGFESEIQNFDNIVDIVDDYLEKVADNIDILKGIKKDKKDNDIEKEILNNKVVKRVENNQIKTQISELLKNEYDDFDIDNSFYPFIPKIKVKYHAITPLDDGINEARLKRQENSDKYKKIDYELKKECKEVVLFNHPYRDEIVMFTQNLNKKLDEYNKLFKTLKKHNPDHIFNIDKINVFNSLSISSDYSDRIHELSDKFKELNNFHNYLIGNTNDLNISYEFEYLSLEKTKFTYVDNINTFEQMIKEISLTQEIAIDLEHHNLESFLGITCLMQISTRFSDFVIDTLKMRKHMQDLNIVFCDPKIIKVFHGADFDIEWLQKDFGIYVVNMFDTGQAARILNMNSFSLANLLSSICGIIADKKYQLADWRMRPLNNEMLKYAREDTHYLLYIYDFLKHKLIEKALIQKSDVMSFYMIASKKSSEICLKQYVKPIVKSVEFYQILSRNVTTLNKKQISILKLIFKFRDYVARKMDSSPSYVLNNRIMFNIVKLPNYDIESLYLSLDKYSHFRNYIPELYILIEKKLKSNSEKIDKNNFKLLQENYVQNMKIKINQSKSIANKIIKNSQKEMTDTSPVIIKIPKPKVSILFEKNENKSFYNINKLYQGEYNDVIKKFENFNIVNFIKEKYNKNIHVVDNTTYPKKPTILKEKIKKDNEFLKVKRTRDDIKDLTDIKISKKDDSDSESSQDIEIKPNLKLLMSQVNEIKTKFANSKKK